MHLKEAAAIVTGGASGLGEATEHSRPPATRHVTVLCNECPEANILSRFDIEHARDIRQPDLFNLRDDPGQCVEQCAYLRADQRHTAITSPRYLQYADPEHLDLLMSQFPTTAQNW